MDGWNLLRKVDQLGSSLPDLFAKPDLDLDLDLHQKKETN